jgi:hypothetical protein
MAVLEYPPCIFIVPPPSCDCFQPPAQSQCCFQLKSRFPLTTSLFRCPRSQLRGRARPSSSGVWGCPRPARCAGLCWARRSASAAGMAMGGHPSRSQPDGRNHLIWRSAWRRTKAPARSLSPPGIGCQRAVSRPPRGFHRRCRFCLWVRVVCAEVTNPAMAPEG